MMSDGSFYFLLSTLYSFIYFTEVAVIQHLMFCMKKLIAYYDVNNQFVRLLR